VLSFRKSDGDSMYSFKYNSPLIDTLSKVDLKHYYCGTEDCDKGHSWGPAVKDHYKIHYIHSGKGVLKTADKIYELSAGQCFLIYPDTVSFYRASDDNPWTYYWVAFNGLNADSYLTRAGFTPENPIINSRSDAKILECFDLMFEHSQNQQSGDLSILGCLYNLLSILIDEDSSQLQLDKSEKKDNAYITKAIELIEMNYSSRISIEEIANNLGLNRKYFSKLFKETVGSSPIDFLVNFRLNKACDLMLKNEFTIGEVSRSVGYDDQLLFSRTFRKFKGISPSEFRKNFSLGGQRVEPK
jgi:AraC-like DNA-binding protein